MIGEAFTLTAAYRKDSALHILDFASGVPEIEFRKMAMPMLERLR